MYIHVSWEIQFLAPKNWLPMFHMAFPRRQLGERRSSAWAKSSGKAWRAQEIPANEHRHGLVGGLTH